MAPAGAEEAFRKCLIGGFELCKAPGRQVANIDGLADFCHCFGIFTVSIHADQRDGLGTKYPCEVDRHVSRVVGSPEVLGARQLVGTQGQKVVVVFACVPEAAPCPGW